MKLLPLILSVFLMSSVVMPQEAIEFEKPIRARSLSGVVVDNAGHRMPGVLIERLGPDRKNAQDKTVADGNGLFVFSGRLKGKQLLRLTKDGWSTLYVSVIVDTKTKSDLQLAMIIAR